MQGGVADEVEAKTGLWFRAFGVTAIGATGEAACGGLGAKALGMVARLAANAPAPMTRDALVDLLWERVDPAQGKGSLRQELRRLKRALGPELFARAFDVADNHIGLRPGVLETDVARLEAAARGETADEIAPVLEIYAGGFLADNAARAQPFQDWADERRRVYEDMAISALTRLAMLDLEAGRLDRCQEAADRAAALDPLHEPAQEALIRRHIAAGRPGLARTVFEAFRARMLRELGAEPAAALAALVAPAAPRGEGAGAGPRRREPPAKPMVAVLNVSRPRGEEQAYLAAGVVEELVANLARSSWVRVASLNAPFMPREAGVDIAQRELRGAADYVLRVNVQIDGKRAAITANMTRVDDASTMYSDRLEDSANDLLGLQRRFAIRIAATFEEKVIHDQGAQARDVTPGAADEAHWRMAMRARWLFWKGSRGANAEAQRLLGEALARRPDDAPTLCLLAFSHMLDGWCGWRGDPGAAFDMAREIAGRAARAAPDEAWPQFTYGTAVSVGPGLEEARRRMRRAIDLAPGFVAAIGELGRLCVFDGETEEGTRLADQAIGLSPYDQHYGLWLRTRALAHWMRGELAEARELIDYSVVVRPAWFMNHVLRAAVLVEMGETEAARTALAEGTGMVGGYSTEALRVGHPFRDPAQLSRFAAALNRAGGGFRV